MNVTKNESAFWVAYCMRTGKKLEKMNPMSYVKNPNIGGSLLWKVYPYCPYAPIMNPSVILIATSPCKVPTVP